MSNHAIQMIPLAALHAHPGNANVMGAGMMRKLERHIAGTGRYEPLVVRRHPELCGEYQLINGHHRKLVLEKLGHAAAACLVWELDDAQTLLLLATVNRLCGRDRAGKRLELLRELGGVMAVEGFEMLLPEDERTLRKVLAERKVDVPREAAGVDEMEEAFTVFLKHGEVVRLRAALAETDGNIGRALMRWVERFGIQNSEW